jgi:asparagine synthase (glutamine-hydrolysing)
MCGIAGIYCNTSARHIWNLNDALRNGLTEIKHRGPDDYGIEFFSDSIEASSRVKEKHQSALINGTSLGLGHRRLSILDTSDAGHQPMASDDGNIVIIFNGEIYNYLELKAELGGNWRTGTDTEVIIEAYRRWGKNMLQKFDGMFSFVLLDKTKMQLFGARDVAGIKPFYYIRERGLFAFGSEPKVLSHFTKHQNASFDGQYISEFLLLGLSDHDEGTMINGVKQIKGGYAFSLDLKNDELKIFPYHSFSQRTEWVEMDRFKDALYTSFRQQLRSDVPIGTSLSGGIDSSAIASLIGNILPQGSTYNALTFTDRSFEDDESQLAMVVAKNAGLKWINVTPSQEDLKSQIIHMIKGMGEPFSSLSMFAQYSVMRKANELGIKVMLDGQGGDELYLGYPRMAMRVMMEYLRQGKINQFRKEIIGLKENLSIPYSSSLLGNIYFNSKSVAIKRKYSYASKYVNSDYLNLYRKEVAEDFFAPKAVLDKQKDEFYKYCLPRLLRYADRNSMAFSVESRVPHLANRMIDMALAMPVRQKVENGWTKKILRDSMIGIIPNEILWSKVKRGFGVPQAIWVKQIESELLDWVNGISNDAPFNKTNILRDIREKPDNKFLWPVLSTIAINQLSGIKFE